MQYIFIDIYILQCYAHTYMHTHFMLWFFTQSCLTLCDPMDCRPPGSQVHGVSRQEYWSGYLFPSPADLANPGIKSGLPYCIQILY